jgi:tryptophan synthase beta chain
MEKKKIFLSEDEIPRQWYNINADIKMNPPMGPEGPVTPDMLAPVFPMNLIEQEVSAERWIDIPEGILEVLNIWRPSPMVRAYALEKALDTPARIYYKYEGVSPPGSHKPNTVSGAVPWPLPVPSMAWNAKCLWFASALTKNRIARP